MDSGQAATWNPSDVVPCCACAAWAMRVLCVQLLVEELCGGWVPNGCLIRQFVARTAHVSNSWVEGFLVRKNEMMPCRLNGMVYGAMSLLPGIVMEW